MEDRTRHFRVDMNVLIAEQVKHWKGDCPECREAIAQEVRKDPDLLNWLTNPRLESVIAEWMRDWRGAERGVSRPSNREAIDNGDLGCVNQTARDVILNTRNGKETLDRYFADQSFGAHKVKDWIPTELIAYVSSRRRAMNTEASDLRDLERLAVICQNAGKGDVPIGDTLTVDQIEAVRNGETEVAPTPKRRGSKAGSRLQA
jgi:hypothetical protein